MRRQPDVSKLEKLIDFRPRMTIGQILDRTIDHYRDPEACRGTFIPDKIGERDEAAQPDNSSLQ